METIKNYLNAMFSNMPDTPEVRKAKAELLQMMEDKYNELLEQGESENNAVGTVISEFGNLDELAEDLGVSKEVEEARTGESDVPRRNITTEEAEKFLAVWGRKSLLLALGVMITIVSIACPIIGVYRENLAVAMMFILIALGVGLIVFSSFVDSEWRFIRTEPCRIDMNTAAYVKEKRKNFEPVRALCITLGVVLCIISWVPCLFDKVFTDTVGPALIFVMVGIGVFLMVYSSNVAGGFNRLLAVNDSEPLPDGSMRIKRESRYRYTSKGGEMVMKVYWPTVTCIYLAVSFLTFQWHMTWIIWPIAAVARRILMTFCVEYED